MNFDEQWLITRVARRKEVPFWVHTMADNIFGLKFPQNRQKWPSIGTFEPPRTASRRMTSKKTDVPLAIVGQAAYNLLFIAYWESITAVLYFPMIKHRATKVSANALFLVWIFSFCKVYTAFVSNLFFRLLHKKIPCAVCWKASKT